MHLLCTHFIFKLPALIVYLIEVVLKDTFTNLDVFLAALHHLGTLQMELWPWERHPSCKLLVLNQSLVTNSLLYRLLLVKLVQLISREYLLVETPVSQRRHLKVWTVSAPQVFLSKHSSVRPSNHPSYFFHLASLLIC